MDNWYTSYALALSLLTRKLTCIGTMRRNKREIAPEFLPKNEYRIRLYLGTKKYYFGVLRTKKE